MTDRDHFMIVSKNMWKGLSAEQKEWLLFDTIQNIDTRLHKLEKRKTADKVFHFLGNTIGSFSAVMIIIWAKIKIF